MTGFATCAALIPALTMAMLTSSCSQRRDADHSVETASVLIRNVQIVDGTGAPGYRGAVRIIGAVIDDAGSLEPREGDSLIDGGGLVLAPGFIDTHSHGDRDLLELPAASPAVSQGVTTIVVGQDGGSPFPLAEFFDKIEATPVAVNIAAYAGHNTIRSKVMGSDYRRKATEDEVDAMAVMLRTELESGALGLSTGLEYDPGIYSDPDEVLALAQLTADSGGRYISHIRSEDRELERALDEIIDVGRVTGMPVQISHIKLAMKRLWGEAPRILEKLDAARADGVDISADVYPYEYWQSNLMVLLPERDYTDRAAIEEALDQIAPPDGLWMTRFDPQPEYVGMTLTEIAEERGVDPAAAFIHLARASAEMETVPGDGADTIIGTSMREDDIVELLRWPHTNICTDGAFVDLHPRARGSFTRVLGRYVRDRNVLPLEDAVHRMTGLAAEHMNFRDRGVIRAGARADLVLFDPDNVADRATPKQPERRSEGIESVWVAGQKVFEGGRDTGARPGVVIRRSSL